MYYWCFVMGDHMWCHKSQKICFTSKLKEIQIFEMNMTFISSNEAKKFILHFIYILYFTQWIKCHIRSKSLINFYISWTIFVFHLFSAGIQVLEGWYSLTSFSRSLLLCPLATSMASERMFITHSDMISHSRSGPCLLGTSQYPGE